MTMTSAMSVSPRTSMIFTLTAFMSSSAAVTMPSSGEPRSGARRGRVRVVMCADISPEVSSALVRSIAPRFDNDLTDFVWHEITRIRAREDDLPYFRRRDLELRHGVDVHTARFLLMQL